QFIHKPFVSYCKRCTLPMTCGKTRATYSASCNVDSRPSEKRSSELGSFFSTPSALMTWEGSSEPAEHAEPLEAQMPSISSPASKAMLSEPWTRNETVFVRRCRREPTNSTP